MAFEESVPEPSFGFRDRFPFFRVAMIHWPWRFRTHDVAGRGFVGYVCSREVWLARMESDSRLRLDVQNVTGN